ncbi:MAG TPA: ribosome silencing factor [Clostridiaceae bacterium]|nr:ribosome silencing factor [Clostridiaceae bacterium]
MIILKKVRRYDFNSKVEKEGSKEKGLIPVNILETAHFIENVLDEKKGYDIELIDVRDKTTLADFFIIASGSNKNQVKALADEVQFKVERDLSLTPRHIEGQGGDRWILLDYMDIVVHIFEEEERAHYSLEKLWSGRPQH